MYRTKLRTMICFYVLLAVVPGLDKSCSGQSIPNALYLATWGAVAVLQSGSAATSQQAEAGTGFETEKPGEFQTLQTKVGVWTTINGTVQINGQMSATGKQCLHLTGGEKTTVELSLADGIDTEGQLTFRAERWTKRPPFSFRIEKRSADQWSEIYNGDQKIIVGRPFKSNIVVPLNDKKIDRLRWTVTSPPNTGVMIDDLRIAPAQRQRIVSVETVPFALPALIGAKASPLVKLKVKTVGNLQPLSLKRISATLEGTTDMTDIDSLQLINGGNESNFISGPAIELDKTLTSSKDEFSFSCPPSFCQLAEGTNYLWIGCKLSSSADIDHRVGAACKEISFSNGETIHIDSPPSIQQMGVSVRSGGDDGVHTFRIPGLATTKKGTLIAVYDIRHRDGSDLPGDIDVGMSRSIDGGRTWQPMQTIMDMGDDADFRYDGIGDPAVLVDNVTGTIWCAATWSHGNRSWTGSGPGLDPAETGQLILVNSNDDGVSWSQPINLTRQVKKPEWSFLLAGPGKGITMSNGTLAFAAQYQDPPNRDDKLANRLPHSAFIFSRDHGKTWDISLAAYDDTTESQVVELADGQIMINCRYNRESKRVVMTTDDMGKTWQAHPTSRTSLVEPGSCMASLINVGRELRMLGQGDGLATKHDFLLFSNPDSTRGRNHLTIKASRDTGATWPAEHHLLLDEQNGRGYSCLTMIDAETVGILYEGSQADMTFQRVKIADILNPPSDQKTKNPAEVASTSRGKKSPTPNPLSSAKPFAEQATRQQSSDSDRPNILLIVSEDNGPELGCYGDPYAQTPNLDAFAAQSIRFETAYVTQSVCSPSRSTLLTGLFPHQNGQIGLATHHFQMFKAWPSTYSILKEAGYRTGMLGKLHINPEHVIEDQIDFRAIRSANFAKKNLADYTTKASEFVNASAEPFFLSVNFPDAHWPVQNQVEGRPKQRLGPGDVASLPYIGFDNERMRGHIQGYYNCLTRLDECVGELLAMLDESGKAENTLVIYIGDHGAQFARGKIYVTEGGLRIPFILRWPGKAKPGYASKQMVSTIDILPTIVSAAKAEVPGGLPGINLAPILDGDESPIREYLFAERNSDAAIFHYPQRAVRDPRYKLIKTLLVGRPDPATHNYLIHGASNFRGSPTYEELETASPKTQTLYADWLNPPEYQLFDLQQDPQEFNNLANDPRYADVKSRLIERLTQWQRETGDRLADAELLSRLNAEVEQCLKDKTREPTGGWKYIDYLRPEPTPAR